MSHCTGGTRDGLEQVDKTRLDVMRFAICVLPLVVGGCGGPTDLDLGTIELQQPIVGQLNEDFVHGAYVDLSSSQAASIDFECGSKTFVGHSGVDFLLRNFKEMDLGVAVLAAAPGQVESVVDTMFDRNAGAAPVSAGNHVTIQHGDGIVTLYAHLRKESIPVMPGQRVETGQPIGLVGSSGFSNWPHLHFEVQRNGERIDPFAGACNPRPSLWVSQPDYQNHFQVLDAGVTLGERLGLAELLERPPDVDTVSLAASSIFFWVETANQTGTAPEIEVLDPADGLVSRDFLSVGPSFGAKFFGTVVPVAGTFTRAGVWTLRYVQDGIAHVQVQVTAQ